MKFDTLKEQIAYFYGKAEGVESLITPWLNRKADIDKILQVARQKSIRFHDIAEDYKQNLSEEKHKDFSELTAGELMKKLIDYSQSGAPVPFMQFMMEQWMETIQEVEELKNVDRSMYDIRIEPSRGTTLNEAAQDAQELADTLDKEVFFAFNGTECIAIRGGHAEKIVESFVEIRGEVINTNSFATSKGVKHKFN